MTWGNPPKFVPTKAKSSKVIQPEDLVTGSEDGEQSALFCWAALSVGKYPMLKWLHSIPNSGERFVAVASKMIATGLRKGVPDICLPFSKYKILDDEYYHGCYIELKIEKRRKEKNGGCSEEQIEWIDYLSQGGYCVRVCYGWIEARDVLIAYMEGKL